MDLTAIEFIAQLLNQQKSKEDGYGCPVRWGCLREDLREKYLAQAKTLVENWAKEELEAEKSRREAKVLDQWFDAVYEEKKVIRFLLDSSNKGKFEVDFLPKITHIDSGCMKDVPVAQWKEALKVYEDLSGKKVGVAKN